MGAAPAGDNPAPIQDHWDEKVEQSQRDEEGKKSMDGRRS